MRPLQFKPLFTEIFSRKKRAYPIHAILTKGVRTRHRPKGAYDNFKMMEVNRVHVLVVQFRKKITEMAMIQDFIKSDVVNFNSGNPGVRGMFKERRQYYLDLLGISVKELRKVMHTPEIELPPEEIFVENVTRRVKPITKRYLERLVRLGRITDSDMDCILEGGYASVEEFFEDVYDHVGTFGIKKKETPPSGGSESTTQSIEIYDEDGFLEKQEGGADQDNKQEISKDDDTDPQKKTPEKEPAAPLLGSGHISPPVKLEVPTKTSDDDESDAEEQTSSEESEPEPTKQDLPSEEDMPPLDTESGDSDSSDESSSMDCPVDDKEITTSDIESSGSDSDSDDSDTASVFENSPDEEDVVTPDAEKTSQPFLPALPKTIARANNDDDDDDDDERLDVWLPSHKMFYWQYEVIYAAILTAFRFRERFQSARAAYKVDPYADWE
ncbi:hypothetical protein F4811DRAFT_566113 [Daldinia bambusicola]|nr:hypothetical protein F4811DRAFT_566113 [Daldinia bambusicola]